MSIGGQRPFPNLRKQVSDTRVIIQRDTQRQCIDKETNQTFELMVRTIGDRGANNNIILTTQPGEYDTPGRQQGHK
ncbi:hypothetical protein Xcab_04211 [Xenorhabdus cabanillasii JM26]|nr:hypothetical protein Xcab_04211 [Xenorhabdus cabanillasii JM26]